MSVTFLVPTNLARSDIDTVLRMAVTGKTITPFDPVLVQFVTDFAKSMLLDRTARAYPELIVLANFFKTANVAKLKEELTLQSQSLRMGRGLVFHIAPSNVDSVFLYSSLLSLLCGNVNLIRISRKSGAQVNFILDKLASLLADSHAALAERFFVVTYEHDDAITARISAHCHMRVVWGGDATVNKIRSLPLRPTASEICFPDRFSAAMLHADSLLRLDQTHLTDLCSNFYNDAIWFAQQACSSPRLVAWIGDSGSCMAARQRFWEAFQQLLLDKDYENSAGMVMDRFVTACMVATDDLYWETAALDFPTRILLKNSTLGALKHFHCGNGLFFEQCFESIPDFFRTLTASEQTLAVFGFEAAEVTDCLRDVPMRSIDRVTKIGNALDFSYVWDGCNLLNSFTRQIAIDL